MFPEIRDKLVREFWDIVYDKLKEFNVEEDWIIEYDYKDVEFVISKDNNWLVYVSIGWLKENCYYGIYFDGDSSVNRDKGLTMFNSLRSEKKLRKEKHSFGWDYFGEDFRNKNSLRKILPLNRHLLAEDYASKIFDFIEAAKEELIKINK